MTNDNLMHYTVYFRTACGCVAEESYVGSPPRVWLRALRPELARAFTASPSYDPIASPIYNSRKFSLRYVQHDCADGHKAYYEECS